MTHNHEQGLIQIFIAETQEFLQVMEESLLILEGNASKAQRLEAVKQLFRLAHSIKGSASMFGFEVLTTSAHRLEDCFAILRDRVDLEQLEPTTMTQLLTGFDCLKAIAEKTFQGENITPEETTALDQIRKSLETQYGRLQQNTPAITASSVPSNVLQVIFERDLPPLFEQFETELSQAKSETLEDTLIRLNEFYYQLSGIAGMLQVQGFTKIIEPLQELIKTSDLTVETLQQKGWLIAQNLQIARQQILNEEPISVTEEEQEEPSNFTVDIPELTPEPQNPKSNFVVSSTRQRPTIRVDLEYLTELVNLVGELIINRTHLETQQAQLRSEAKHLRRSIFELNQLDSELRSEYDRLSIMPHVAISSDALGIPLPQIVQKQYSKTLKNYPKSNLFDPLELDQYHEFHTTAQSVIETTQTITHSVGKIDDLSLQLERSTDQLRRITHRLRSRVLQLRVVPFSRCVDHLPRALRDLCRTYNKEVNLVLLGRDTKIDESLVDALRDPLVHLLRNAFDHGIESPEFRLANGKSPTGQIEITARHQGGQTIITITDDGRGINSDLIRQKAIAKGFISAEQAQDLTLADWYEFLFLPGFSTTDEVTNLSGRGVGLDVVRCNLRKVRGTVKVDSRLHRGTCFILKLPLMLSITNALMVRVDHNTIAIPLDAIEEIIHIQADQIQMAGKRSMIAWREEFIRFTRLQDLLHYSIPNVDGPSPDPLNQDHIPVLVIASAEGVLAVAVERLLGQQEIVVKPLPAPLSKPKGIVGSTILGNGQVVMIVDVDDLIEEFHPQSHLGITLNNSHSLVETLAPTTRTTSQILVVDDSYTIRQLLAVLLKRARYRVELAKDGQEALDKLQDGLECDLVIADIEMPRMDGFELLRTLKSDPQLNSVPVAMLTSRNSAKHRKMAMDLGAVQYFTKPYNEMQLLEAIANILKDKREQGRS